ncbi:MAG: PCRF domain-containing protein, partial [Zetaproteobacteria bacterium]
MSTLIDKLEAIERRHGEITERLSDPAVLADQTEYQRVARLHAELNPTVDEYRRLQKLLRQMEEVRGLLQETGEPEMRALASAE